MKKQPEITAATREAFVDAFFQLAKKKKISQITVREITNLAGYNRTTFYRYFEDVYALVEYSEDAFLLRVKEEIEEQSGKVQMDEQQFFRIFIRCVHENKEQISVLLSEENRSHFLRRACENVPDALYRPENDTPKKKIIRDIYFFGIFHAISINLKNDDMLSDEDLIDIIQKLFTQFYWPELEMDL